MKKFYSERTVSYNSMSSLASGYLKYSSHLEQINRWALVDPERMILEMEEGYDEYLRIIARNIYEHHHHAKIAMLSGPSSSGKTTTAHLLKEHLSEFGIHAEILSLDNFYRGRDLAPLRPDGTRDYESIEALNVDRLKSCLWDLVNTGRFRVPSYNFNLGAAAEEDKEYVIQKHDMVIIEGIHALNPFITKELPEDSLVKLYVSVKQMIKDANGEVINPRDLRLVRRMVRDIRARGTNAGQTLQMWASVIQGEDLYIRPYRLTADYTINSIHMYEPCIFRAIAVPILREIPYDSPIYSKARHLESKLMRFESIAMDLVPPQSMLREFIGNA